MRIAGWIFLCSGVIMVGLILLKIRVDRIDVFNAVVLVIGITMIFGSDIFFRKAKNPDLKPMK